MKTRTALWINATIDILWSIAFGIIFIFFLRSDFASLGINDWGLALRSLSGLAFASFLARLVVNLQRIEKLNEQSK